MEFYMNIYLILCTLEGMQSSDTSVSVHGESYVMIGHNTTLTCRYQSANKPSTTIEWFFRKNNEKTDEKIWQYEYDADHPIPFDYIVVSKVESDPSSFEHNILLHNVDLNYEGTYTCKVTLYNLTSYREDNGSHNIVITVPPNDTISIVAPTTPINDQDVSTFNCVVPNVKPQCKNIVWTLDDTKLSADDLKSDEYDNGTYREEKKLQRRFDRSENGKTLVCEVSWRDVTYTVKHVLNVTFVTNHLEITGTNSLVVGENFTLACEAGSSNPAYPIFWKENDKMISEDHTLSEPQPGRYDGFVTKSILHLPAIISRNGNEISCHVGPNLFKTTLKLYVTGNGSSHPNVVLISTTPNPETFGGNNMTVIISVSIFLLAVIAMISMAVACKTNLRLRHALPDKNEDGKHDEEQLQTVRGQPQENRTYAPHSTRSSAIDVYGYNTISFRESIHSLQTLHRAIDYEECEIQMMQDDQSVTEVKEIHPQSTDGYDDAQSVPSSAQMKTGGNEGVTQNSGVDRSYINILPASNGEDQLTHSQTGNEDQDSTEEKVVADTIVQTDPGKKGEGYEGLLPRAPQKPNVYVAVDEKKSSSSESEIDLK